MTPNTITRNNLPHKEDKLAATQTRPQPQDMDDLKYPSHRCNVEGTPFNGRRQKTGQKGLAAMLNLHPTPGTLEQRTRQNEEVGGLGLDNT